MEVDALAPGKLVLLGEYAVLEGGVAVCSAVDCYARITVSTGGPSALTIDGHRPRSEEQRDGTDDPDVRRLPDLVLQEGRRRGLGPVRVHASIADFFARDGSKLGLGSSAALVAGLWGAVAQLVDLDGRRRDELLRQSLEIHRRFQEGLGSGVDLATSVFGGTIAYRVGQAPRPLDVETGHTAAIWTGAPASTASFLQIVRQARSSKPASYRSWIGKMADASERGLAALENRDLAGFGECLDAYGQLMAGFGDFCGRPVVNADHAAIGRLVREAGGSYKPSGAGGGDVGLAWAPEAEGLQRIVRRVREAGYSPLPLALVAEGLRIFVRDPERGRQAVELV